MIEQQRGHAFRSRDIPDGSPTPAAPTFALVLEPETVQRIYVTNSIFMKKGDLIGPELPIPKTAHGLRDGATTAPGPDSTRVYDSAKASGRPLNPPVASDGPAA